MKPNKKNTLSIDGYVDEHNNICEQDQQKSSNNGVNLCFMLHSTKSNSTMKNNRMHFIDISYLYRHNDMVLDKQ